MTPALEKFAAAMRDMPLIAILRGLTPGEAPDVGDAIVGSGFRLLEVPLNSPQPLESIAMLRRRFPDALVGAGTVLDAGQVREVHAAGGELIVAPNFDVEVVSAANRPRPCLSPGRVDPHRGLRRPRGGGEWAQAVSCRTGLARRREGIARRPAQGGRR